MNADHYRRVLKVLDQVDAFRRGHPAAGSTRREAMISLIVDSQQAASHLWKAEFPSETKLDLSGANIPRRSFWALGGSTQLFVNADFRNAILDGSSWMGIILNGADFSGASLAGAKFHSCAAKGTSFRKADLSGAYLDDLTYLLGDDVPADMTEANLSGATIVLPHGKPMILKGARMAGAKVIHNLGTPPKEQVERYKRGREEFITRLSAEQRQQITIEEAPQPKSGCFIATAAYGSADTAPVQRLCDFRDVVLRRSVLGRVFIGCYEFISPPVAGWIAPRPKLCALVRTLVVRPLASMVEDRTKIENQTAGRPH